MKRKFISLLIVTLTILGALIPGKKILAEEKSSKILLEIVPVICNKTSLPCPSEQKQFFLVPSHTWTYSPGGQTNVMKINGKTNADTPCVIWIKGDAAIAEDCNISYQNSGIVYTDEGPCTLTGNSNAVLSFKNGKCRDGHILITITETQDPDAGLGGNLTCPPDISTPYVTFYPPSLKDAKFVQHVKGDTIYQADSDQAGFEYIKKWTFMRTDLIP